jgi:hypothetical protein
MRCPSWINERLFEGLGKGNAGLAVAGMCLMKGADGVSRSSECKQGQTQGLMGRSFGLLNSERQFEECR